MKFFLKTVLITSISALAVYSTILVSSCNWDKCKTIICANGGVCNGGACTCPSGYEGSNCETTTRQKFEGNWTVFEKGSTTLAAQYYVKITDGPLITDVLIYNFNSFLTHPIRAIVSDTNIIIPNQVYNGKYILGNGTIHYNTTYGQYGGLTMYYEVIDSLTQRVNDYGYNAADDLSQPSQWNK